MAKKGRVGRIPQGSQRDYRELDSVNTEPTEEFMRPKSRTGDSGGKVDNVGPAFRDDSDNSPVTFGHLRTIGKIASVILGIISFIAYPIWWAATVQNDVKRLTSNVGNIERSTRSLEENLIRHDEKLQQIQREISKLGLPSEP